MKELHSELKWLPCEKNFVSVNADSVLNNYNLKYRTSAGSVSWLIHYPGLDNVCRGAHDGSDQPGRKFIIFLS
jgi:hypothetical protein